MYAQRTHNAYQMESELLTSNIGIASSMSNAFKYTIC